HLDVFDFAAPVTIGFFTIVALMVLADVYFLLRQPAVFPDTAVDLASPPAAVRAWLAIVALITAFWGLALFLTDGGPSDLIWLWPGDLLTSRLIGVMLLTMAAGAVYSQSARGTARPMLAMILVYGLGIALANFWNTFTGKPVKPSYTIVFAIFALVSAVLLLWDQPQPAGQDVVN
ncbi:MAG: hypothetical protein ACK2UK_19695, partial [Candidatus Promineifilaceae bacterium]